MTTDLADHAQSAEALGQADQVVDHLRSATRQSFPLYTYKELKRLLRCEYHRFISELRETRTWSEISLLTGMTRVGLTKLGDEVPPRNGHSVIRTLLAILQERGDEGMALSELAGVYYSVCPDLDAGPDLREALKALLDYGSVRQDDGRYIAVDRARHVDGALANSISHTVSRMARRAEADPSGPTRLHRISFRVPRGAALPLFDKMFATLVEQATEAEAASDDGEWCTVVLGHAPQRL